VGVGRPTQARWLLDDGALDTLSREVPQGIFGQWSPGHLLVVAQTASDAARNPARNALVTQTVGTPAKPLVERVAILGRQ
jgi:hypothetical protein